MTIDPDSYTDRLTACAASICTVETDCPKCGGTGEVVYEREKRLDELSGLQKSFLLTADLERESPNEEQQQEIEQMRAQQSGHGQSAPTGGGRPSPSPRRR